LEQSGSKIRYAYDYDFISLPGGEGELGLIGVIQQDGSWECWQQMNVCWY
jgi:hypothetical protein